MTDWSVRPLDAVYAAVFIDPIVVKVRDGQVANRPFYAAIGVTLEGDKDIHVPADLTPLLGRAQTRCQAGLHRGQRGRGLGCVRRPGRREVGQPCSTRPGRGRTRWTMRWKPALNAFAITFSDRSRPLRPTDTAGNTVYEIVPSRVARCRREVPEAMYAARM
jgi:hypothetical protein